MFDIVVKTVNGDTQVYKDIIDVRKLSDGEADYCDQGNMGRYWMRDTEGNIKVIELTVPSESIKITRNNNKEPDKSIEHNTYPIFLAYSPEDGMWVATCPDFPLFSVLGKSRLEVLEDAEESLIAYAQVYQRLGALPRAAHAYQIKGMWEDAKEIRFGGCESEPN